MKDIFNLLFLFGSNINAVKYFLLNLIFIFL